MRLRHARVYDRRYQDGGHFRGNHFTPAAEAVITYDCFPPPAGTIFRYNPNLTHSTVILRDFLQQSDTERIEAGASTGGAAQTFPNVWTAARAALNLDNTLNIDLTQIPDDWERVIECRVNRISLEVRHQIYDVDATATAAVTVGAETFPSGDRLASFRVCKPMHYRFVQHTSVNPLCCPNATGDPASSHSNWFPPPGPLQINVPGEYKYKWFDPFYKWPFYYQFKFKFLEPQAPEDEEEEEPDPGSGAGN